MDQQNSRAAEVLYRSLTAFIRAHVDKVAELEILPSSYPLVFHDQPILQDGHHLAIRNRDLAAAYIVAHRAFYQQGQIPRVEEGDPDARLLDTVIMIFFAPEHLTIVNWRKRFVEIQFRDLMERSPTEAVTVLARELHMLDTFCTSPLSKHPKSPTLWQHRYWLVSTFMSRMPGWAPDFLAEMQVVLRAADKHFANYTAFDYARRLWSLLLWPVRESASGHGGRIDCGLDLEKVLEHVRQFCFTHPRDISGWTFWTFLVRDRSSLKNAALEATQTFVRDTGCKSTAIEAFLRAAKEPLRQEVT